MYYLTDYDYFLYDRYMIKEVLLIKKQMINIKN